ncbi:hypothetical protein M9434_004495 [Picochlorum sp. BPE23]|nr:hypothetical protein M9435_002586 [Picochlorum sp. BPE23]KAI8110921.1 hypothetical protein M9434_004495 [Picochlorum sp. BPE23]
MPADGSSGSASGVYTCSKLKLDSLFLRWFSLPESQELVLQLLESIRTGQGHHRGAPRSVATPSQLHSSTPPVSPRKGSSQMRYDHHWNRYVGHVAQSPKSSAFSPSKVQVDVENRIPRFYFPEKDMPFSNDRINSRVNEFLRPFGEGLPLVALKTLLREIFGLPVSLGFSLHRKIASLSENVLPVSGLLDWFASSGFSSSSQEKRLFDILRSPSCDFITPDDLRPTILGIIVSHPGLAFLKGASEFQDRYAETVIYRIFYSLNPSGANRLSLRDIKKGKLLQSLLEVESEEDVNQCTRFFSYEHFYVIYCKFWDLDTDHDFLLSRDDFLRYGNHSLTYRVADRIFDGAARPLSSGVPNKMGYEDFVWFILSEEDKTSDTALQYWFRACDLNGDDKLTQDELLWFYEEQISRMECLSQETVAFDDIMSQMVDMINPKDAFFFTVRDLKNCRLLAGILFNVMFNLSKFVAFEMRDPFTTKQEREGVSSGLSEWDRYARDEYARLAMEDEDMEDDGMPWAE